MKSMKYLLFLAVFGGFSALTADEVAAEEPKAETEEVVLVDEAAEQAAEQTEATAE